MAFEGFRNAPFPTLYGDNRSAVTVDVLEVGLIVAFASIALSMLLILPGAKDGKQAVSIVVRGAGALFIGLVILICNFGYEWQKGTVTTHVQYKQFVNVEVEAEVGLKIGLRGVNITLKANGHGSDGADLGKHKVMINNSTEQIDYNEHFDFGWDQQQNGFGPNAALLNREFREAQQRGMPLPILTVAEYFVLDGEGIRWGRLYRQAGYYTHLMLWLALPLWALSCMLLVTVLVYGAIFLMLTGASMLIACVTFVGVHTLELELKIPFQEDATLTLSYGWCFGLALATGLLCMLIGNVIIILHMLYPVQTSTFFGTDLLEAEDIDEAEKSPADEPYYEPARPRAFTSVSKRPASKAETPRTPMRPFTRLALGRQHSTGSNKVYASPYRSALRWRAPKRRPRSSNPIYPSMVFQKTEPVGAYAEALSGQQAADTSDHSTIVLYDAVKLGGSRNSSNGGPPARPPPPHMREAVPLQLRGNGEATSHVGLEQGDSTEPYQYGKYSSMQRQAEQLAKAEQLTRTEQLAKTETPGSGAVEPSPTPPLSGEESTDAPIELREVETVYSKRPGRDSMGDQARSVPRYPTRPAPIRSSTGNFQKPTPPPRVTEAQPKSASIKKAMMPPRAGHRPVHESKI